MKAEEKTITKQSQTKLLGKILTLAEDETGYEKQDVAPRDTDK